MSLNTSKSEIQYKNYKSALNYRNDLATQIAQRNSEIIGYNNFISIDSNIDPFKKEYLNNANLNTIYLEAESRKSQIREEYFTIKEEKDRLTNLIEKIKSKNPDDNQDLINFLVKNNTVQQNGIKRFFKIPKNPLEITNKDIKKLVPIIGKDLQEKINVSSNKIASLEKEKEILIHTFENKNTKEDIESLKEKYKTNELCIENFEKQFKKVIEKIVDLDFPGLRKALKENNINTKSILLFISELFNKKPKIAGELNIPNEKLKALEVDLNKLEKEDQKVKIKNTI